MPIQKEINLVCHQQCLKVSISWTHSSDNDDHLKRQLPKLAGVLNSLLPEVTHWENAHHDDSSANARCHKCAPIGFTWKDSKPCDWVISCENFKILYCVKLWALPQLLVAGPGTGRVILSFHLRGGASGSQFYSSGRCSRPTRAPSMGGGKKFDIQCTGCKLPWILILNLLLIDLWSVEFRFLIYKKWVMMSTWRFLWTLQLVYLNPNMIYLNIKGPQ